MKKIILSLFSLAFSLNLHATEVKRILIPTTDNLKLDAFLYLPSESAKGIVLAIGGSGFTRAGFGGPSKFSKTFAENGFVAVEWNKRGITTNNEVNKTDVNFASYNSATINNIFEDASQVLKYMRTNYPTLKVFVVGGSEGSVTTTLLAEYFPQDISAVATFGNVVTPFIQVVSLQLTDLFLNKNWDKLDTNKDKVISKQELLDFKIEDQEFQQMLTSSFSKIDVSADDSISFDEMAAFITNYFVNEHPNKNYWYESSGVSNNYLESMFRIDPLTTRANSIVVPVFMAQGEDDWNTPAKYVYEFQIQTKTTKLKNFSFKFYPKTGHAPSPDMLNDFLKFFNSFVK